MNAPPTGASLAQAFHATLGHPAEGVWSAPGRVNLIGEHLDYNDGPVLPFAIGARTFVAAARRPDPVLTVRSLQHPGEEAVAELSALAPGALTGWPAYVAGMVWALRDKGLPIGGLDLLVDGRVPLGAGLSSSAALECATALAVADLYEAGLAREELAALAQKAENVFVGMPCGLMDQMASMLCTAGHALLFDTRDGSTRQIPMDVRGRGGTLLVVDTRVHHELTDGGYADRTQACVRAAAALGLHSLRDATSDAVEQLEDPVLRRRARHVVSEIARVHAAVAALERGDFRTLGALMQASHASLRDDYEVSCAELDTAVEAAVDAGAYGARMTGAGFGGSAVVLLPAARVRDVTDAVRSAASAAGHPQPALFTSNPGAGAGREPQED